MKTVCVYCGSSDKVSDKYLNFARQMAAKVLSFYREQGGQAFFVSPDNYYANNWAWLGLALYNGWVRVF